MLFSGKARYFIPSASSGAPDGRDLGQGGLGVDEGRLKDLLCVY